MSILSYRAAARRTGVSLGTVQYGLKTGKLSSLNEQDVLIWGYGRKRHGLNGCRTFQQIWRIWQDASIDLNVAIARHNQEDFDFATIHRNAVDKLLRGANSLDERMKYAFSEAVFLKMDDVSEAFCAEYPKSSMKDLHLRFCFCIYFYAKERVVMSSNLLREFSSNQGITTEDVAVDSFRSFCDAYLVNLKNKGEVNG